MKSLSRAVLALGFALVFAPTGVRSDTPGRHPLYIHARSDMRAAQLFMRLREDDPKVSWRLHQADLEIEAGIKELDRAAVIDHKDLVENPQIDVIADRPGRLHKIVDLLRGARRDLGREEDNPNAVGWRDLAFKRIDNAMDHIHRAAVDLKIDRDLGF
jgi:hypothetical protein